MKKWFSRIYRLTALTVIVMIMVYFKVYQIAKPHIFSNVKDVPKPQNRITSRYLKALEE